MLAEPFDLSPNGTEGNPELYLPISDRSIAAWGCIRAALIGCRHIASHAELPSACRSQALRRHRRNASSYGEKGTRRASARGCISGAARRPKRLLSFAAAASGWNVHETRSGSLEEHGRDLYNGCFRPQWAPELFPSSSACSLCASDCLSDQPWVAFSPIPRS